MGVLGQVLSSVGGLGILVCFILVLVQMFKRGQTGLGIACIVLICCGGIGFLVAFIYGWVKNREWGITNIMFAWTAFWVMAVIGAALNPVDFSQLQQQMPH
jgi:hypothetical protein